MQRLARTPFSQLNQQAIDLFNQFADIKRLLARHLPPSTLQLFAEPVVRNGVIEWYSDLEGQPVKVDEKKRDEQLQQNIQNKLSSIHKLVAELQSKNAITVEKASQIEKLLTAANYSQKEIYLVNREPVLVGWGMGEAPKPAAIPTAVAPVGFFTRHRWCAWLLPLLLLLMALLAWWWFFLRQPEPATVLPPPPTQEKPKEEVKKEEPKPEPAPALETAKNEPKVEENEPKTIEPEKIEPEIEADKVIVPDPVPIKPEPEPEKPTLVCKETIKPGERPQMVMIFDNSISMLVSLLETKASVDEYFQRVGMKIATQEMDYMEREPRRLTVAKNTSATIIDKIDPNIDIGLISLNHCPSATNSGFYTPNKRKALKAKIRSMYPDRNHPIGGTPLYNGLAQAAMLVDGVKRDAFILLVSDGEDTCQQGDLCQLAHELAIHKPRLKINVVDIGNAQAANCVANATGGKVFTANSKAQVSAMINKAIKPVEKKQECK